MKTPAAVIDGAKVLCYSAIDSRQRPTGNCRHVVVGESQGPAAGLAVCQYDGDDAFYLFYCDADWAVVTDTWHASLKDAKDQAEFEYEGVSSTWETPASER